MTALEYNPLDPRVRNDPYPYYAALRRDAPVYRVPGLGLWAVSRHEDVLTILRRPDLFSQAAMGAAVRRGADFAPAERQHEAPDPNAASVIGSDPPEHTRLRNIVNRGFTPRRIAALEGRVREIASRLAERFISAGECDVVADYAVPLPVTVIAELLGVDPDRQEDFKRWSDAMIRAAFDSPSEEEGAHITQCLVEVNDYLETVMDARRECPAEDLVSTLVHAEAVDGTLTSDELKIFVFTLLAAGNVTTTNLVANATRALVEHPAELAKVTGAPSLIPSLVEEALRYDAPVQWLLRTASRDVELAGVTIPAGSIVAPLFASANRDERVFAEPDRFDVTRGPRDHVAFGHGIHFCLGAALARLEARVAFETLLPRVRNPVLAEEQLTWVDSLIMRGPKRLRLRFEPMARTACPRATARASTDGNEAIIRRFIDAWSRLDPAELAAYFSEDGVYHNVPMHPVTGRANIEQMIRTFTASWTATRWELRNVLAAGNVVMAERIDRTQAGGRSVALPIVGVFELERGEIKIWRDYFDLGTYVQALS